MRRAIMTAMLAFALSTTAHMQEYQVSQEVIDRMNARYDLRDRVVNKSLEYNVLSHIPVSSPLKTPDIRRVSDLYGPRRSHPVLNIPSFHRGIDFSARVGTPVLATAEGTVESVIRSRYGYGNKIILKHDNDYSTVYAHLFEIKVTRGDTVIVGQEIGTVGNSGLSTGPHLHYEIRRNGKPIDPLSLYQINLEEKDTAKKYLAFLSDFESVNNSNS
jgi:murein DD-endopeptidase MepM/ murein hydrolase activator NlpD